MSEVTVCEWRGRFIREPLDGLYDEPRPGAPRRVSDAQVEQVIVRTLEETPRGETHWSSRGMAKASRLGRTTIQQIWRAFGLQPHRTETFKLSTDPLLIEKVRDIVGLYMQPPTRAVVFCVDEKSQIQALTARNRCCRCAPARSSVAGCLPSGLDHHVVRRTGRRGIDRAIWPAGRLDQQRRPGHHARPVGADRRRPQTRSCRST